MFAKIIYYFHIELNIYFVLKIAEENILGPDLVSSEINGNLVILHWVW